MFYAGEWWYKTARRSLESVPEVEREESVRDAAVIFFHVEAEDAEHRDKVLKKWLKNTKWIAGKFGTRNVVLHSFNHLSESKADAGFAEELLLDAKRRLEGAGYSVMHTPFGYFNEFSIHVAGDSLAKVFKAF